MDPDLRSYSAEWEFLDDVLRLIESGATLRDLYDALLRVTDPDADERRFGDAARVRQLATVWTPSPSFLPIRLRELFGGAVIDHDDDYILALVGALGARYGAGIREFVLREDTALRHTEFWRIFSVEGGGEVSLANIDKYSAIEGNWKNTVVQLSGDGLAEDPTKIPAIPPRPAATPIGSRS